MAKVNNCNVCHRSKFGACGKHKNFKIVKLVWTRSGLMRPSYRRYKNEAISICKLLNEVKGFRFGVKSLQTGKIVFDPHHAAES